MNNDPSERGPESEPDPTPVDRYEPPAPRDDGTDRFDAGLRVPIERVIISEKSDD